MKLITISRNYACRSLASAQQILSAFAAAAAVTLTLCGGKVEVAALLWLLPLHLSTITVHCMSHEWQFMLLQNCMRAA